MEFTLELILLLVFLSFLAGTIASIAGIGGGVLWVPLMTFICAVPIDDAIDTSTFIILITSGAALLTFMKDERLHMKQVLIFSVFSILGGLACALMLIFISVDNSMLKILFATTLLIAGLNMVRKAINTKRGKGNQTDLLDNDSLKNHNYQENLKKAIPLFFFSGFAAYLLGIGGGIINTPVLHIILDYPIHNSTATSVGIVFFTAIFNTILKIFLGQINYSLGLIIVPGAVFGAVLGAKISSRMPKMALQLFVAIVVMILAIRMFL